MFEQIKKFFGTKKIPNQKQRILKLLEDNKGEWVSVVEIMRLSPRIACYTARITELKKKGYQIWNKTKWVKEGPNLVKYSKYKLIGKTNEK